MEYQIINVYVGWDDTAFLPRYLGRDVWACGNRFGDRRLLRDDGAKDDAVITMIFGVDGQKNVWFRSILLNARHELFMVQMVLNFFVDDMTPAKCVEMFLGDHVLMPIYEYSAPG